MKTRQTVLLTSGLVAAAVVYALALYPQLPAHIPIHWNLRGHIDGWGDKRWAVWVMPALMVLMIGMQLDLPLLTPQNLSMKPFRKTFDYLLLVCAILLGYIHVIMLQAALHPGLEFGRILMVGLFLSLALMGNVFGRLQRNMWMGIRTPWAMANDAVWVATHRLAGYLLMSTGIMGAIALWLGVPVIVCMAFLMAALLIPAVYSFIVFKRMGGSTT